MATIVTCSVCRTPKVPIRRGRLVAHEMSGSSCGGGGMTLLDNRERLKRIQQTEHDARGGSLVWVVFWPRDSDGHGSFLACHSSEKAREVMAESSEAAGWERAIADWDPDEERDEWKVGRFTVCRAPVE